MPTFSVFYLIFYHSYKIDLENHLNYNYRVKYNA